MNFRVLTTAFLLMVSSLISANSKQSTYTIGVASWAGWSFVHVALHQGFFEEAGINVDVKWYSEPHEISKAFEKGTIDFRLDFVASVVSEYLAGSDVKLLAETNWSHGGDKIITKRGVDFENRKGSTIGIYRDSPALTYFLHVFLKKQRMNLSDFKVTYYPLAELQSKFVDDSLAFAVVFDPYTIDMVQKGNGTVRGNSAQFPGCMPEGIYAKASTIAKMPAGEAVAFMGACARASDWLNDPNNWERFAYVLNQHVLPDREPFSDKELMAMMKFVKVHNSSVLYNRNKDDGGVFKYLEDLHKFMSRNNLLTKKDFKPADIVDNTALLRALHAAKSLKEME